MKSKNYRTLTGIVFSSLFLFAFTGDGITGDIDYKRDALKGLEGVYVLIEPIRSEAQEDGLTEVLLQTDVELQLRKAGIKVLTKEECFKTPGAPYLYINVNTVKFKNLELYSFNIKIELTQYIQLERNPSITIPADTWSVGMVGSVVASQMKSFVRESLGNLVDKFINDYLVVNPI